jgi:hypothetical protein
MIALQVFLLLFVKVGHLVIVVGVFFPANPATGAYRLNPAIKPFAAFHPGKFMSSHHALLKSGAVSILNTRPQSLLCLTITPLEGPEASGGVIGGSRIQSSCPGIPARTAISDRCLGALLITGFFACSLLLNVNLFYTC